jgi:hypothetical protein
MRAEQAAGMLSEGHLFGKIWDEMDREIVAHWRAAKGPGKFETREELHLKQRLLEEIKSEFYAAIEAAARAGSPDETKGYREILQRLFRR